MTARPLDTVPAALFWHQLHPDGAVTVYWNDAALRPLDPFSRARGPFRSATAALESIRHLDGDDAAERAYVAYYGAP